MALESVSLGSFLVCLLLIIGQMRISYGANQAIKVCVNRSNFFKAVKLVRKRVMKEDLVGREKIWN